MKVLEEGPGWSNIAICKLCESKLLVEINDIYFYLDENNIKYYRYTCPVCGKINDLKVEKIPTLIKKKIIDNTKSHLVK